ncbi:hypothetical protein [Ramlibacter albus]|uniref:Uncharacterized protein n=1 Tax=Ramlibacter albus TaxID=2079448 RepID=A0A923S1Z0_9BURK|nr:hypothetical protein [Ramlibacter albus]MBC5764929.1 hypothetical protein [Ramlibacter albus]
MSCRAAFALAAALGAALPAGAQPQLGSNEVVFKSSNWSVIRTVRRSGAVACTGFYQDKRDIQLSEDALAVFFGNGLKQVVTRYGDDLSQAPRPPTAAEIDARSVVVTGPAFEKLVNHRRFAVEVETETGRKGVNLRLQGFPEALANIKQGCPVPGQPVAVMCPPQLLERMRANGVTADQVRKICY